MNPDIEKIYARFTILKDEFEKMKTMVTSALKLVGPRDVQAYPRSKRDTTARRQYQGPDATGDVRAALLDIVEFQNQFEDHLLRFNAKFVMLGKHIPDSHQPPNPADENVTPASDPASDPDPADEPQAASPETAEDSETRDGDDTSQGTASTNPSSPPLSVDYGVTEVEVQTESSAIEEPETASVADANQDTTSIDPPSPRPPLSGRRTPLPSSPMPRREQTLQAPPTQDEPDQNVTTQDQDETPPAQDEAFLTLDRTAVHPQDEHIETPTAQEFRSFLSLYARLSREHEHRGFVLIRVPSDVLGSCSRPTQPQIAISWRQTLRWKTDLVASVEQEEVGHDPPSKWHIADVGQEETGRAAFAKWHETFGPGGRAHLPNYAMNVDIRDPEGRKGVCLPATSPIYPLPGNVLLASAPEIQGITTPEAFCSEGFGTVFTLHTEDYDAPSINVNHSGSGKLWVVIPRDEHKKLTDALDRDGLAKRPGRCHQYIRHESLFLHPSYLDENQIRYRCFVQAPGIAVLVFPGAAHFGFNLGANIAEALNYVPQGWVPPILKRCACSPDQDPITRSMFLSAPQTTPSPLPARADSGHKRRGDTGPALEGSRKKPRADHDVPAEPAAAVATHHADKEDPSPKEDLVQGLVDSTTGAASIRRFMSMVKTWRHDGESSRVCMQLRSIKDHDEQQERIKSLDKLLVACRDRSELFSLLEVLASVRLYRNLGRQISRVTTYAVDQLLEARGLTESKRPKVHEELKGYRKWDRFCGECEGILCFVPPACKDSEGMSRTTLIRMCNDDIDAFRSRVLGVQHTKRLCEIGQAFEQAVFGEADFEEQLFETYEGDMGSLGVEELLGLLKVKGS